ncbi:MAG: hypothetical protein RL725_131 [Actinomycetota bacterium]
MSSNISIRALTSLADQELGRMVFDKTWAMDAGTEITPNLLQAMVHSGAYLSGAFVDGNCVGAAFAFPATTGGPHLHSHMTAVLDKFRDKGIGYALKVDQYKWAKENNYKEKDRVDVILANPPFGGIVANNNEKNFPQNFRTKDSADLFLVLMIHLLKNGGRAGIVLPDGSLTGEGIKRKRHPN